MITPDGEYEEFILQEQRILCQDLLRPLYVLGFLDENTPSARKFTLMYLLNQGSLSINTCEQINDSEKRNLLAIASVFCDLSPMFENTFWLFKEFVLKLKRTQISLPDVVSIELKFSKNRQNFSKIPQIREVWKILNLNPLLEIRVEKRVATETA